MTDVIWKPIPSCPGHEASSDGQIRAYSPRWRRTYVKTLGMERAGYLRFWRLVDDKQRWKYVHQAVTEAFYGPRPDGAVVRHLDGDPLNNAAENLAWGTVSENALDKVRHGRDHNATKTHCKQGHAFDDANTYRGGQGRQCRTCNRAAAARYAARRRLVNA